MTPEEWRRFEQFIEPEPMSGCWLWSSSITPDGYGLFWFHGSAKRAPRLSFEHFKGPIADGLELDHRCRTTGCVNPAHLEAVTGAVNRRRKFGMADDGVLCGAGHLDWYYNPRGVRRCRTCNRIRARERRHAA